MFLTSVLSALAVSLISDFIKWGLGLLFEKYHLKSKGANLTLKILQYISLPIQLVYNTVWYGISYPFNLIFGNKYYIKIYMKDYNYIRILQDRFHKQLKFCPIPYSTDKEALDSAKETLGIRFAFVHIKGPYAVYKVYPSKKNVDKFLWEKEKYIS